MTAGLVCVVGSVNLDTLVRLERLPEVGETLLGQPLGSLPGGKGFNQAVAAARSGAPTRFCAQVGDDPAGAELRLTMLRAGLDVDLHVSPGAPTGSAYIAMLADSENSIIVAPGANAELTPEAAAAAVPGASVVLTQLEIDPRTAEAALAAGRRAGARTILNAAPADGVTPSLLAVTDLLVVNETEADALGGVDALLRAGPDALVVTLGSRGARWLTPGGDDLSVRAFDVDAVDTTGAGDAFCGALAAALAGGADALSALLRASAAGAVTATAVGAQTEALTPAAIDRLLVAAG
ncbi:ribokinase [Leifsonia sp. NPDC058194]|uniref:ribokinase n=1 Tax=Leifsonia sp. NPDC058194 TaxID=3346374 RepID=UPI0036DEDC84